jgi:hypothetical protein
MLSSLLNSSFSSDLAIQSVATTGIITTYDGGTTPLPNLGGAGFATNDATLLDSVVAGQWIRVSGYANANDGLYRVTAVDTTNNEVQVSQTAGNGANIVDADASTGAEVNIQGSYVRNGTSFRSFYIEKQLSATAPTGRVIDTVAGFSQLEVNDTAIAAVVQGISWNVTKNNARAQYGLGQADAQGMARGTIDVSGTMSVYFTDFTLYTLYKNETDQIVSFAALDDLGQGYIFTLPGVTLMNPQVVAGGPDTDVVSEFELEGNGGSGVYDGVIMQIDKIPAAI